MVPDNPSNDSSSVNSDFQIKLLGYIILCVAHHAEGHVNESKSFLGI